MLNPYIAMTEAQIERAVERQMNRLDARLLGNRMTQGEYDHEVMLLDKWADQQYRAH